MEILYKSGGLIAVNKRPGLTVHAAPGPGSSVLAELLEQTGLDELTPVHRLDKDASGVLLFSETKALAAEIQRTWESAEKVYLALCDGVPKAKSGTIDAPILENQTGKPERFRNALRYFREQNPGVNVPPLPDPKTSSVHPAGRTSQTSFEVLAEFRGFSRIKVCPNQGRMHQIRVHLAHIGHPLTVDPIYGKRTTLRECDVDGDCERVLLNRLPLHASRLTFLCKGEPITIDAPFSSDMESAEYFMRIHTKIDYS